MIVFLGVGIRLGVDWADFLQLPADGSALLFGLVGILFGLVITPWITVRPVRALRRSINEWPVERLLMSLVGVSIGLFLALLAAFPLSLLDAPLGTIVPTALMVTLAYLGLSIFGIRSNEILTALAMRFGTGAVRQGASTTRKLLLDTSVLIDGRIADIAETDFLGGVLIVPRFVLNELHRVADSSDPLRRKRGRRGLNMLNKLQRAEKVSVRIIEDDFEDIVDVDDKLVALALQMNGAVITNDYPMNRVAEAQGVPVLNINELANAVRSVYIPGETFAIRVIQSGTDPNQGVGYLEDGTMVVIENGKRYMDRTTTVEVTKLINRPTGRMIFAVPLNEKGAGT